MIFSLRIFFISSYLLYAATATAEYRAFQYSVRSTVEKKFDTQSYLVISTLDPVSYRAYHGGAESLQINVVRTWMCLGHTGQGKDICQSPESLLIAGESR